MNQNGTNIDIFSKLNWLLFVLSMIMVCFVYLAYIFNNDLIINSELASDILLGREMRVEKSLIPASWFYQDSLSILGAPLISAFISFFTDSMLLSYRLAVLLMFILEIFAYTYMAKNLNFSKTSFCLIFIIFFGVRSFISGTYAGMGFCSLGSYYVIFFLTVGYLAANEKAIASKSNNILKFLIPLLSIFLGLEGLRIILVLFLPLFLFYYIPNLKIGKIINFNEPPVLKEIIIWNICSIIGYMFLLFIIVPRGHGPLLPYTREIKGLFYAVVANIPSICSSFVDETPLSAIKEEAKIFTIHSIAAFAFLFFCVYLLYVLRRNIKQLIPPYGFPIKLLLISLSLTFFITAVSVIQVKFIYFFYFYLIIALLLANYSKYLENENLKLAKLLNFATAILVILVSLANFANLVKISENNTSRAVIQHSNTIEKITEDWGAKHIYALYPDSYPLEVLTDARLKVGALLPNLTPYYAGSTFKRFNPDLIHEKSAFVFPLKGKTNSIYKSVESNSLLDKATGHMRIDDKDTPVDIYLFDKNPFTSKGKNAAYPEDAAE
jgi:hypothetical protein